MNTRMRRAVATCACVFSISRASAQTGSFDLVGVAPGRVASGAYGLSADGHVAAGYSNGPGGAPGFIWTREQGRYDFGLDPNTPTSRTLGISGDGSTVVGGGANAHAYRWRGPGTYQDLGLIPGLTGLRFGWGAGTSGDGSVVVGVYEDQVVRTRAMAFRWPRRAGCRPWAGPGPTTPRAKPRP